MRIFLALLSLRGCAGFSLVLVGGGYSRVAAHKLLAAAASPVAERGLWGSQALTAGAHGLSCSVARGIFPDQGLNTCLVHGQADSLPLSRQGSPKNLF